MLRSLGWWIVLAPLLACSAVVDDGASRNEDPLGAAPPGGFAFARDVNERRATVPIDPGRSWRVVYSVALDALSSSERLAVRGEVTLSKCVPSEGAPCARVTPFDPRFSAKVVLGQSADDASGPDLTDVRDLTCSTRDHHCTLVLDEAIHGGFGGKRFANLVVAASGNGSSIDVAKVEKGHGGVYVTRIGAGADASGKSTTGKDVSPTWMDVDDVDANGNAGRRDPHVTLRARLDGVKPGDIVDVDARIVAKIDDGSCDPLVMNQIFVSTKNDGDPEASKIATLTAQNGTNCTGASCNYRKSGADVLPKGTPSTVWVAVVSKAGRSCAQGGDRWQLGGASELSARVRR